MKKILSTMAVFFFATTLNAIAASHVAGTNETLKEEQIQQQDMKRKETLDDMQVQAQKRKQQLQQQSTEIQKHQERLGLESDKSSGKTKP